MHRVRLGWRCAGAGSDGEHLVEGPSEQLCQALIVARLVLRTLEDIEGGVTLACVEIEVIRDATLVHIGAKFTGRAEMNNGMGSLSAKANIVADSLVDGICERRSRSDGKEKKGENRLATHVD